MKQILITLLCLLTLSGFAQKRVYWVGSNQISVENADGSNAPHPNAVGNAAIYAYLKAQFLDTILPTL